jgi:hypothetical protein
MLMTRTSLVKGAALLVGVWTIVGLLTTGALYVEMRNYGMQWSVPRIFASQLLSWYGWAALTPAAVALARRFRFERGRIAAGLAVHVPASLLLAALHMAWVATLNITMPMMEPREPESFWKVFSGLGYTLHIELVIYWAVVGATHAFSFYALYRERDLRASELEAQLANAQLQALRAQLQPHFLFNTLHGIAGLVRTGRGETAVEMIAGLSDLLRLALENPGRP